VDDEDQTLILLYLIPPPFEHFLNNTFYGSERDSISIDDVQDALNSKEVKRKVSKIRVRIMLKVLMSKVDLMKMGLAVIEVSLDQSINLEKLNICIVKGIVRHCIVKRNTTIEWVKKRMNVILLKMARFMLSNASFSKEFWVELVNIAAIW
jgi:hypothetical protein